MTLRLVDEEFCPDDGGTAGTLEHWSELTPHTESQARRLAGELFVQLPASDHDAVAVAEHLLELARWRAGAASGTRRAEQTHVLGRDETSTKLMVVLTHSAMEERLSGHGFSGAASNYAARVIRSGVLAPRHFKA